ncbi:MAG: hypothetical protein NC131_15605 [Roseburia sp.]|nr:hypothetical protein [Roseburia sp.]
MVNTIMIYGMLVLIGVIMWFPGFMCARNMVKAVSERNPTIGENILAAIPVLNLLVVRKQLYGSAKIVWVMILQFIIPVVLRIALFFTMDVAAGAYILIAYSIFFYLSIVVFWVLQGYVLFDAGNMIQAGTLTKILAFIIPPLSMYFIGRDCIPMMRMAMAQINGEDEDEEYYDDEDEEYEDD